MHSPFRHFASIFLKIDPIHLTFFLTKRCNAHCPFCFYLKSSGSISEGAEELDLEEIEKISRSFGRLLWLAFSGGEIFLRKDLPEIAGTFYKNNSPAIMLFPTNGLLPEVIREQTEKILHACPESVIAVKLSMDGIGLSHDALRNTPDSFDRTMETYQRLEGLLAQYPNFELGINTVYCSENQNEMDRIIDFVAGMKNVKTHTISLVRGDLAEERFKNVNYTGYLRAVERLEQGLKERKSPVYRFRGAKIKAAQDILQRRLIHRTMQEQKRLIPCYAGRLNLVLSETGEIYPCEILTKSLGNIRDYDYDISKLMKAERASEAVKTISSGGCYCTHECYFMTNILFNPRLYPALLKEYMQL